MPRFVFKLQPVLKHRQRLERDAQVELAARQAVVQQHEQELRLLQQSLQEANRDVRQHHLAGRLDMGFLMSHRRFVLGMHRKAMEVVQKMALAQRRVEEARGLLLEAARQRKIMEKLRERHLERWRAALAMREMNELDEIGTQLAVAEQRIEDGR